MFYGKSRTYFLDEAAAVKAMQEYIHTANADFGVEKHKKRSVGTDKSEDLIKICFSSCDGRYTNLNGDGNKILFISDLDTCYSWKTIIDFHGNVVPFTAAC